VSIVWRSTAQVAFSPNKRDRSGGSARTEFCGTLRLYNLRKREESESRNLGEVLRDLA